MRNIMGIDVYSVADFMRACAATIQAANGGDEAAYSAVEQLRMRRNTMTVSQEEFEAMEELVDAVDIALEAINACEGHF